MNAKAMKTQARDKGAEARGEILRHAEELFAHYGYAKTNIGDIAGRASMSPGNLYRYFENKRAIGLAVCAAYFKASEAEMQAALDAAEGGAEARIRALITTGVGMLVREMRQNPKLVELAEIVCEDADDGELVIAKELSGHLDWRVERLTEEVGRGARTGELAPVGDPAQTAMALLLATKAFWIPFSLAKMELDGVAGQLEIVLELVFRGLRGVRTE